MGVRIRVGEEGSAARNTASHIAMTEAQPTRLEALEAEVRELAFELDRLRAVETASRKMVNAIDRAGCGFECDGEFWERLEETCDALGVKPKWR